MHTQFIRIIKNLHTRAHFISTFHKAMKRLRHQKLRTQEKSIINTIFRKVVRIIENLYHTESLSLYLVRLTKQSICSSNGSLENKKESKQLHIERACARALINIFTFVIQSLYIHVFIVIVYRSPAAPSVFT